MTNNCDARDELKINWIFIYLKKSPITFRPFEAVRSLVSHLLSIKFKSRDYRHVINYNVTQIEAFSRRTTYAITMAILCDLFTRISLVY